MTPKSRILLRRSWCALGVFLSMAIDPSVSAEIIGVDSRNGFSADSRLGTGASYDEFRAVLTDMGHQIVPVSSFTASDLVGLDGLILKQPYFAPDLFTAEEITAIQDFVRDGGGLLVHGDGGGDTDVHVDNLNELVAPFGGVFADRASQGGGHIVVDFANLPRTEGIGEFGVDFHRRLVMIDQPAFDLTIGGDEDDAIAALKGAGPVGSVVMCSDTSCWIDEDVRSDFRLVDLDNELVLRNLLDFMLDKPFLRITGGCPGDVMMEISGARPYANVVVLSAQGAGATVLPGPTCGGVSLGLDDTAIVEVIRSADAFGRLRLYGTLDVSDCGRSVVQAMSLVNCRTSNVVAIE